jgi:hypothetical protein
LILHFYLVLSNKTKSVLRFDERGITKSQNDVLKPKINADTSCSTKIDRSCTYEDWIINISSPHVEYNSYTNIEVQPKSRRKKPKLKNFKNLHNLKKLQCSVLNYRKDLEEEFGYKESANNNKILIRKTTVKPSQIDSYYKNLGKVILFDYSLFH